MTSDEIRSLSIYRPGGVSAFLGGGCAYLVAHLVDEEPDDPANPGPPMLALFLPPLSSEELASIREGRSAEVLSGREKTKGWVMMFDAEGDLTAIRLPPPDSGPTVPATVYDPAALIYGRASDGLRMAAAFALSVARELWDPWKPIGDRLGIRPLSDRLSEPGLPEAVNALRRSGIPVVVPSPPIEA